ncbi:hypothetical protein JTB14_016324 [Gonioctena quinquepunctata]|nr:hypothetical protein JTB14_016324 [Gonioctena quinquepunctata]
MERFSRHLRNNILLSFSGTYLGIGTDPPLPGPSSSGINENIITGPFSDAGRFSSFESSVSCLSDISNEELPRKRARTELSRREINVLISYDMFVKKFPDFGGKILEVYRTSMSRLNETLIKDAEYTSSEKWANQVIDTAECPISTLGEENMSLMGKTAEEYEEIAVLMNVFTIPLLISICHKGGNAIYNSEVDVAKPVKGFVKHLTGVHKAEDEVRKLLSLEKHSIERKNKLLIISGVGDIPNSTTPKQNLK